MISEQRREATKLTSALINTLAAAFLLSGLVAPFLPGATKANTLSISILVTVGILVHFLAQGVLYVGLNDALSKEGHSNEPDSPNGDNRSDLGERDHSSSSSGSSVRKTHEPEIESTEDLEL